MNPELTEILIGKYLDSEITPAEQQLLDKELKDNPDTRQLLAEMEQLHQQAQRALAREITDKGDSAEAIFERAWQQKKAYAFWKPRLLRFSRTAATLAAGFILGLGAYYFAGQISAPAQSPQSLKPKPAPLVARNTNHNNLTRTPRLAQPNKHLRLPSELDWYSYTDSQGRKWLIEAPRDNALTTANYDGTL